MTVATGTSTVAVSMAGSVAAQTSGPIVNASADLVADTMKITKVTNYTAGGVYYGTPVYINPVQVEGAFSFWVDVGGPADFDGDGTPDSTDSDDDNDGRPDESDDFPKNANEKDDTDNDGTGDNADLDDDNDGTPDLQDDAPYDPLKTWNDRDSDGIRDSEDKFPDNWKESGDNDDDGVGDNTDADDDNDGIGDQGDENPKTPDVRPGITPVPSGNQGDGQGNPGTGDGSGGPGPQPGPGPGPGETDEFGQGQSTNSDETGAFKPGVGHDVAGSVSGAKGIVGNKIGSFRPFGSGAIPSTTTYVMQLPLGGFGDRTYTFHFDESPWTLIRSLMLLVVVYVVGRDCFERLSI
ncbi:thrombospondin type 3 repeat-containing protein [Luteolibacter arcticus]|uniref:Thrombospondin type 3 repeat-containing protein n=1 Tax=Luteolibacter arcticus TaxID=1581411 RepID=A0ABT3GD70_9BACT|nr:thrombospondin type 3 repeat-containing protein [Luteolibacter arcticus]MCW1921499.1 thrombospondin type 3 repeat-containing protein [Luteolibacter arcticus]